MDRRITGWALLADAIPFYPLYALFFADSGMSAAEIAALLAIWSVTGLVAEVPSGALSDRFSRRRVLAAGGLLQAAAYAVWLLAPSFAGFAVGFVLWGIGTSLYSGTVEALAYEGLAAVGAQDRYATLRGHVTAAGHAGQIPAAFAATALVATGGYPLVGWVSVGICLAGALLTWTFPDPPRTADPDGEDEDLGYFATLRSGLGEAVGSRVVRGALVAAALVAGIDALEEFYPLIVGESAEVTLAAVPVVLLVVTVALPGLGRPR
ncbi:MFS transporter, partial [Pseudonocardia pini]|uniref:MFS transporter n=1 Tax=Pseudonocardia pini TaxID=2758030 RepID=UPI0028A6A038